MQGQHEDPMSFNILYTNCKDIICQMQATTSCIREGLREDHASSHNSFSGREADSDLPSAFKAFGKVTYYFMSVIEFSLGYLLLGYLIVDDIFLT